MRIAYKYRLYPTKQQADTLGQWIGQARYVYNFALACQQDLYELSKQDAEAKKKYSTSDLYKLYAQKKKDPEFEWLNELPSSCANEEIRNLDTAYKNFFMGLKSGQGVGFPKFKKKQISGSISFQNCSVNEIGFNIPKIGQIKGVIHRKPLGKFNRYTVFTLSRTSTYKYFISFSAELPDPAEKPIIKSVGIDMGATDLAILSTGEKLPALTELKRMHERLSKMQSRLNKRKVKGSNNYKKARHKINLLHEKIANKRSNILHGHTRDIANNYDLVSIEDLNVRGMIAKSNPKKNKAGKYIKNNRAQKTGLAKSLINNSISEFIRMLSYKVPGEGGKLVKIDRYFPSSKTCSCCGEKTTEVKSLSIREWACSSCGEIHDRDINAATNILTEGLKMIER